jgi:hypothetical protein
MNTPCYQCNGFKRPVTIVNGLSMKWASLMLCLIGLLPHTGFTQTNWNAFNDFYFTKGLGWSGSTTPNAWGYKAGNTAGGLASAVGTFLPPDHIYDLVNGGSSGTGNGSGDGNVVRYTDINGNG